MAWPVTFDQCLEIAQRYLLSGQYVDASLEFLKAAERAPGLPESHAIETVMLDHAFDVLQEAKKVI